MTVSVNQWDSNEFHISVSLFHLSFGVVWRYLGPHGFAEQEQQAEGYAMHALRGHRPNASTILALYCSSGASSLSRALLTVLDR